MQTLAWTPAACLPALLVKRVGTASAGIAHCFVWILRLRRFGLTGAGAGGHPSAPRQPHPGARRQRRGGWHGGAAGQATRLARDSHLQPEERCVCEVRVQGGGFALPCPARQG